MSIGKHKSVQNLIVIKGDLKLLNYQNLSKTSGPTFPLFQRAVSFSYLKRVNPRISLKGKPLDAGWSHQKRGSKFTGFSAGEGFLGRGFY